MIQEIINFTNDLLQDIPDIMQWNAQPDKGLHVFIDIDNNSQWTNQCLRKGVDYDYYDGKNTNMKLWEKCIRYQEASSYISMNKVKSFDSKQKIHSCSPFSLAYNFNFKKEDKQILGINSSGRNKLSKEEIEENNKLIRSERFKIVSTRLKDYKHNAINIYRLDMSENTGDMFAEPYKYKRQVEGFFANMDLIIKKISLLPEYLRLTNKDYLHIYLKSVPIEEQERLHVKYVRNEIFSGETIRDKNVGSVSFFTAYDNKKPFLKHKTSYLKDGISQRFTTDDALTLRNIEKLLKRKNCLPNPLPIVIDKREINEKLIRLFKNSESPLSFHELLSHLFKSLNLRYLSDFYLLNRRNPPKGLVIDDFDFVPLFRYSFNEVQTIYNVTDAGIMKTDRTCKLFPDKKIKTIFDFETSVVKDIFNNSLVKINDNNYTNYYFGDIDPKYVSGGNLMTSLILKYRKDIYAYIYKSKTNVINQNTFDDIMYQSILSDIRHDEIKYKFASNNNKIKNKINIWFSLYQLFNQTKNIIMASKITELREQMRQIANGEASLGSDEQFAFGAGQLVSYLIDRSAASNKTYAMLEPYLQKGKISQLQTSISQSIATYKHDIHVRKGRFEYLTSDILTYSSDAEMKPLLRYFLAGCFCPCVIYEKKENYNN